MVLGRFKQNSAVLYPRSYLGEICGEGGSKVRKRKKRSLTSLLLLCKSSQSVCTEELCVLPFAGIQEHNWEGASRTELVQKVDCFVCHSRVSPAGRPGFMQQINSYIN